MLPLPLLAASAHAYVYWGNPDLRFRVDRPADDYVGATVTLDRVRVHHCGSGGSTDYEVDEVIDPVLGFSLPIAGGDHCKVTLYWASTMDIEGSGAAGPFVVRYASNATEVTLTQETAPVPLTPYSVVSGTMTGGAPWLLLSID